MSRAQRLRQWLNSAITMLLAGHRGDVILYATAAGFAAMTVVVSKYADYRDWGLIAAGAYLVAAVASLWVFLRSRGHGELKDGHLGKRRRGEGQIEQLAGYRGFGPRRELRASGQHRPSRWQLGILLFVLVGAMVVPLVLEVAWTASRLPGRHAQPEVAVVEKAAFRLTRGEDPYRIAGSRGCARCLASNRSGQVSGSRRRGLAPVRSVSKASKYPVAGRPGAQHGTEKSTKQSYKRYFPYLPGMMSFGLLSSVRGIGGAGDARISFALITLVVVGIALLYWGRWREREFRALQAMAVLPTAALPLATGGDDIPVLALMFLGVLLLDRRRPVLAGCVLAAAASLKLTAWPLVVLAVFVALDGRGRRARGRISLTMVGILVPVVLSGVAQGPAAFLDDVVRFPLGLAGIATPAASPLPGHMIISVLPEWKYVFLAVMMVVGVVFLILMVSRHPLRTAADVTRLLGWLSLFAIAFAPATRFGYLIYPVNFFVWSWMLSPPRSNAVADRLVADGSHPAVQLEEADENLRVINAPVRASI